jgi:hypothetical protein
MLAKTVDALKADKAKALDAINKGADGFLDRDLYPYCFNISDGTIVASGSPAARSNIGKDERTIKDVTGKPFGAELFNAAQKPEGEITEVEYSFPKPNDPARSESCLRHPRWRPGLRVRLLQKRASLTLLYAGCARFSLSVSGTPSVRSSLSVPAAYSLFGGFGGNRSLYFCESSRNCSRLSANSKLRATMRQFRAINSLSTRRAGSVALAARSSASAARLSASAMCSPSRWSTTRFPPIIHSSMQPCTPESSV